MNFQHKPFRLINETELSFLQQRFATSIQHWNDLYATNPLTVSFSRELLIDESQTNFHLISQHSKPVALLHMLSFDLIKYSVFGTISDSFDEVCEWLLQSLVHNLLNINDCERTVTLDSNQFFYRGSPSLALVLTTGHYSATLYLHPQWVMNNLPDTQQVKKPLEPLEEVFSSIQIPLHIELHPINLPISKLLQLKVGDVIKSDHPLSSPLQLRNQERKVCNVNLGDSTIQLKRM